MLTRQESRRVDQIAIEDLHLPGIVLRENAGRGCVERLLALRTDDCGGVVICCGGGNNGGDGVVMARHLANASIPTKVVLLSPPERYRGDARTNLRVIERMQIPIVEYDSGWSDARTRECLTTVGRAKASWLVDAILGTGAEGELREPIHHLVELMNTLSLYRMAIDLPTGLDCDTGRLSPVAVRADVTCTFVGRKVGFGTPEAQSVVGHVYVIDIGVRVD